MTTTRAACFAGVVKEKRVSDELLNEPIEKRVAVPARRVLRLMREVRIVVDSMDTADTL
jgi:hypothetical protein